MPLTPYQVNKWLNEINGVIWVALHFDDPGTSDPNVTEVFGGSYIRVKAAMALPVNGAMFNATAITFTGMPKTAVTHVGFWDSKTYGNLLGYTPFAKTVLVQPGRAITLPAGQVALSID